MNEPRETVPQAHLIWVYNEVPLPWGHFPISFQSSESTCHSLHIPVALYTAHVSFALIISKLNKPYIVNIVLLSQSASGSSAAGGRPGGCSRTGRVRIRKTLQPLSGWIAYKNRKHNYYSPCTQSNLPHSTRAPF